MDKMDDVITCISCKKTLKVPVILPCGHTICKRHVDEAVITNNEQRIIECLICEIIHEIPSNGFVSNIALKRLIEINNHEIDDLGDEYNSALHKFDWLLNEFKRIKTDPEMRIHAVLSDFRNKIDLRREELVREIDRKALEAIEELNKYENDCKASIKSDSSLDNKIHRWENELKESRLILNTLKRNTNKILYKPAFNFKELQSEFIKFKENLFLNRLDDFMCSPFFDSSEFHIKWAEVKGLRMYKDIKQEKRLMFKSSDAYEISWFLEVILKEIDETDEHMIGIYLYAIQPTKTQRKFKVHLDLVILDQLGTDHNIIKSYVEEFSSHDYNHKGWGCDNFVSLNKLMDDYNLYNIEKDSFTIKAVIKKIEWLK